MLTLQESVGLIVALCEQRLQESLAISKTPYRVKALQGVESAQVVNSVAVDTAIPASAPRTSASPRTLRSMCCSQCRSIRKRRTTLCNCNNSSEKDESRKLRGCKRIRTSAMTHPQSDDIRRFHAAPLRCRHRCMSHRQVRMAIAAQLLRGVG